MTKEQIRNRLDAAFQKNDVLILAHRGAAAANIVDNTVESFDAALAQGADMVEADVFMSTDGELFVFHDGTEPIFLGTDRKVVEMSSAEIRQLRYLNKNHVRIDHPIHTLDQVLEHLKGRCLINLDRCWWCWDKVFEAVRRHNMADQILFKSAPEKQYVDQIAAQPEPFLYMPIIWYPEELPYVRASGANMVAVEFIGHNADAAIMQKDFITGLRKEGIACLISALTLGNPVVDPEKLKAKWAAAGSRMANALVNGNIYLAAGHDDDTSILGHPEDGWGWLVRQGFNIIQTDWTMPLAHYLGRRF